MRAELSGLCCILLGATLALSTNEVNAPATPPAITAAEAAVYATQLHHIAGEISDRYVRPVQRNELVKTALLALYEKAKAPLPAALEGELPEEEKDLVPLIAKLRLELGGPECLKGNEALMISLHAVLAGLDPYSAVLAGKELTKSYAHEEREGFGIDTEPTAAPGVLRIKAVLPGSPGQKGGLRPDDRITQLNGKVIEDAALAQYGLDGRAPDLGENPDEHRKLTLTVERDGVKQPLKVELLRARFTTETVLGYTRGEDNTWNYWADRKNKIALVRISNLDHAYREQRLYGTSDELAGVLNGLKGAGMRGLILDLRWCPGGYLDEAVLVALNFVGQKLVATVEARVGPSIEYNSHAQVPSGPRPEHRFQGFPIAVLINDATSGGAELIAGAIQDHQRGVVIGQRTRGKASIQTVVPLPMPNAALKLTSGTFLRPSGKNLHRFPDSQPGDHWGIRPDREVRLSADLQTQLEKWWSWQTLRPGTSRAPLPLDDLSTDAQVRCAIERLLKEAIHASK